MWAPPQQRNSRIKGRLTMVSAGGHAFQRRGEQCGAVRQQDEQSGFALLKAEIINDDFSPLTSPENLA
jgi:hypothetical protein